MRSTRCDGHSRKRWGAPLPRALAQSSLPLTIPGSTGSPVDRVARVAVSGMPVRCRVPAPETPIRFSIPKPVKADGVDLPHDPGGAAGAGEAVRGFRVDRPFAPMFPAEILRRFIRQRCLSRWCGHRDKVSVRTQGDTYASAASRSLDPRETGDPGSGTPGSGRPSSREIPMRMPRLVPAPAAQRAVRVPALPGCLSPGAYPICSGRAPQPAECAL